MRLYDKVKWILGILMIITLVITTNLVDRNNFLRINDAIETIYEDRLVAKDLIFKISSLLHKKEIAALNAESDFYSSTNNRINDEIEDHLLRYDQTKLTTQEKRLLTDFKNKFVALKNEETEFIESNYAENSALLSHFPDIYNNLDHLSKIQLKEGSRQLQISRSAMDTVDLFTQIEIYILIFLAIVVQIIIMYKPKED